MALTAQEEIRNGYVVDKTTGALSVTTNTSVMVMKDGLPRDADGRLVVVSV
jgi:hypothetical protein